MRRLSRKNQIELGVMTVVFFIAAFLVYQTTIVPRMELPRIEAVAKAEKGKAHLFRDEDHIEQTFLNQTDELLSAGILISLDKNTLEDLVADPKNRELGSLHIEVREEGGGSLMEADYDVCALANGQNLFASFPGTQTGWKDKLLTIVIDAKDICEDVELAVGYTEKVPEGSRLTINGEECAYAINVRTATHQFFYWKKWWAFGSGLVYLLLLGTYFGLAVWRWKPERVFLFTGALLSILYLLLMPPMTVPDEYAHYKEAYYHSNRLLGRQNSGGMINLELEDYEASKTLEYTPTLTEFDILKEEIGKPGRKEGSTEQISRYTQASAILYLPGIIGITLGRLLGLNGFLVIYLGRLCALLFYLAAMYWFIRIMPFGKSLAFILAILPMTIQQCFSYSYDAIIIEGVFLYIALLFRLLYEKDGIQAWQVVLYALLVMLMAICKGGAYMPLCLLTFLIPASRFLEPKRNIPLCHTARQRKGLFVGVMAALAIAAFLSTTLSYVLYVAAPTTEQAQASYLGGEAYGLAGLLADPMNFIYLSVRTLFWSGDGFLETMMGMQLGWLNIFVSRIAIYGWLLLLFLSMLPIEDGRERCQITVTPGHKLAYFLTAGISIGMSFASMYMSWTPKNAEWIAGIQGRYFLPLFPVLLLIFHNKVISIKRDMGRQFMFIAVCLQCVAIYGILLSLEGVL